MVFSSAVALISLKPFFFSLQRSWSFLAYCMGYFSSLFLLIKGGYIRLLFWFGFSGLKQICVVCQISRHNSQTSLYRHTLINMDTSLLRTFYFFPGERKPLYFLFKLFNMDTSLIRRLSMAPSVLTGFDCVLVSLWPLLLRL